MPYPRTRYREKNPGNGVSRLYEDGGLIDQTVTTYPSYIEECIDVVGNFGAINPLQITKSSFTGSLVSGSAGNPTSGRFIEMENVQSAFYLSSKGNAGDSGITDDEVMRALLNTGPLTPKVNLPLFIFELGDIPRMLKHAGDLLHRIREPSGLHPLKEAAAANLAYQFGWGPLIDDLMKLCDFQDLTAKRQDELARANTSKGLRRKVTFTSGKTWSTVQILGLVNQNVYMPISVSSTYKVWGTIRWTIKDSQQLGKKPSRMDAFRAASGLNAGMIPITVWKALPWTWMIDWFTDISRVLQSNYNMIYYTPHSGCRMEHITSLWYHEKWPPVLPEITEGFCNHEQKYRRQLFVPGHLSPHLKVPFLDSFKLSILGSLAIQRLAR